MSISSRAGWKNIKKRMQGHKVQQQGFEQQTHPHALERAGQQRSPEAWARTEGLLQPTMKAERVGMRPVFSLSLVHYPVPVMSL